MIELENYNAAKIAELRQMSDETQALAAVICIELDRAREKLAKFTEDERIDEVNLKDVFPNNKWLVVHRRLGHASKDRIRDALKNGLIDGLNLTAKDLEGIEEICPGCAMGTATKRKHAKKAREKSEKHKRRYGVVAGREGRRSKGLRRRRWEEGRGGGGGVGLVGGG